jgi:hypothetical protein
MHENRVNMRRNTRTCFQCGKPRHFVADCSKKVENKDNYEHKSKTDGKYRSRRGHKSKHKDERRSRKKESRGKARAMVGASDVDSSSAYCTSSSSSSEDEGDRRKGGKSSKNLSRLSCFARDGFCTMALRSGTRRAHRATQTPTLTTRCVMNFPSCDRRMNGLACSLIIVMICLERPRRCGKSLGPRLRMTVLEWLS